MSHLADSAYAIGVLQVGEEAGLDQRGFSGAAAARHNNEAGATGVLRLQHLAQLVQGPRAPEEERRILDVEGAQAAERVALDDFALGGVIGLRINLNAGVDQLPQMGVE